MRTAGIVAVLIVLAVKPALADAYEATVQTINPDPFWIDRSQEEYALQTSGYEPFRARFVAGTDQSPEMVILMEEGLSDSLGIPLLQQWIDDIEAEEYSTALVEISYGTPEEIKGYLDSLYDHGLEGAVLVGDLPSAWVKVFDTQVGLGEILPCDYFFMDLDGEWLDLWVGFPLDSVPGQDGFYDTFQGEVDPEIWTGRMKADNLGGDQTELLQNYLARNHEWRLEGDPEPVKALCYVDDDWAASGPNYQSQMELLYENVILVNADTVTTSQDYEEVRLPDTYSWVSPHVHSNARNHFWAPDAGVTSWNEIAPIDPPARFYNLFACSNARFTTSYNMGGVYTFCTGSGLAAVGSTTSGAMLWFNHFYGPLGGRASLGEAWKIWWDYIAANGLSQQELNWHIGMVLLGDPSLVPAKHLTGMEEPDQGTERIELSVSPNPSSGTGTQVTFSLPESGRFRLELYDLSGRMVFQNEEEFHSRGTHQRILPELYTGMYLVRISGMELYASRKLVVLGRLE